MQHFESGADRGQIAQADALAEQLRREQPALEINETLRPLQVDVLEAGNSLHIDDLTGISLLDRLHDVSYIEDRARLRAQDGDLVVACTPAEPEFERYCELNLGLGSVSWYRPAPRGDPKAVAAACWADAGVRRELVRKFRGGAYRYLHPHIGNRAVWTLALLLSRAGGRPLQVVAPHPGLTKAVNDKNWFADVVSRLFGQALIPRSYQAYNLTSLVHVIRHLAPGSRKIVIKIPDSAGGAGNLVIETGDIRKLAVGELKHGLRALLEPLRWVSGDPLLVASWESDILSSVSSQLWIPPLRDELPIAEAVVQQLLKSGGFFVGSRAADLPERIRREFVDKSWLLAKLFQQLGYVGRCSFDAIVVGSDLGDCRLKFIECNGRWGGASVPMTLMNRLFGDWTRRPYATIRFAAPGLERLRYADLLEHFASDLYDARSGRGRLIIYSPGGLLAASSIDLIAMADDSDQAARLVISEYPDALRQLIAKAGFTAASDG